MPSSPQKSRALELAQSIFTLDELTLQKQLSEPEGLEPLLKELSTKSPGAFLSALQTLGRETTGFSLDVNELKKASAHQRLALLLGRGRDQGKGKRAGVARMLASKGWEPPQGEQAFEIQVVATQLCEVDMIVWLAEQGAIEPQRAQAPGRYNPPICQIFHAEGPEELAALERLVELGALKDDDGFVGFTDFMAHHQFKSAQLLATLGFSPRAQVVNRRFNSAGMSAVASYARLVNEFNAHSPQLEAAAIEQVKGDLNFLAKLGAPFTFEGDGSQDPLLDPFASSVYNRTNSVKLSTALYEELLRHGANPNQSGLWLANEAQRAGCWGEPDRHFVDFALASGADPTLNPGRLFSGLSFSFRREPLSYELLELFQGLGANLKSIPQSCRDDEHPIACGIVRSRWPSLDLAERFLNEGLRADWINSESGETLLHLMAGFATKPEIAFTRRLLADPSVKALVNHQTHAANGQGGESALMFAAGALNAEQIKTLLQAGANPNLQDAQGRSCLHHAGRKYGAKAQKKCASIIALLIEGGADPALVNKKGLTAGQAMAARAPLEGLAALLELRPDDLGGASPQALEAQKKLMARGGQAVSMVENVLLSVETTPSAQNAPGKPKPKRSSL